MEPRQPTRLEMPAFLYGSPAAVRRKTRAEGWKCGEQYLKNVSFPAHHELREVASDELVMTDEVVDLIWERPAWRLHMVSDVMGSMSDALNWQNTRAARDAYEAFCQEMAWGALHFAISKYGALSAERVALRLKAVLRFWDTLATARYVYRTPGEALTLEELLSATYAWAMDAWGTAADLPVRVRLEAAAERMARATKEECIDAIMREMPRAFAYASHLKHRSSLSAPDFLRKALASLDSRAFERISSACTSELIGQLHDWDRQVN